jgi:hypothetical protein
MRRKFDLPFERQKTVLILSGTGTNAWHHYGFLKNFSLEDFNQFQAIPRLKSHLSENFADSQIVYLSLFKSGQKGHVHWVRTGTDRFPLVGQMLDAALMAMGIPNPRHERVYRRSFP